MARAGAAADLGEAQPVYAQMGLEHTVRHIHDRETYTHIPTPKVPRRTSLVRNLDRYKPLLNDSFNAAGSIDGTPLLMRKAYNTIAPSRARFIGHWADVTRLIKPGVQQTLALQLPPGLKPQGVRFESVESPPGRVYDSKC